MIDRERFERDGFAVLPALIPTTQLDTIRQAAQDIVAAFDIDRHRTVFSTADGDSGRDRYFMESAENVSCFLEADALDDQGGLTKPKHLSINKIGHALHDLVPAFSAFCRQAVLRDILKRVGYRAPVLWQSMYIFKQPQIGGEVRWHQDASYLMTTPASVSGIWVAVEDAHKGNGCLWVQPGGHHTPLREIYEVAPGQPRGRLHTLADMPWPTENDALALEVPAGSVVLFSDHLPHYSSHNHSDRSRQAFTMHVAERDAVWSGNNWLQRPTLGYFPI